MTEYHRPEWDCIDDIIDTRHEIGKIVTACLLDEFIPRKSSRSMTDIDKILQEFVQRNVEAALKLAAQGLTERLEAYHEETDSFRPSDGRIDIMEAVRIVRELDYIDEDD